MKEIFRIKLSNAISININSGQTLVKEIVFLEPTMGHLLACSDSIEGLIKEQQDKITLRSQLIDSHNDGDNAINSILMQASYKVTPYAPQIEKRLENAINTLFTTTIKGCSSPTLVQDPESSYFLQAVDLHSISAKDFTELKKKCETYYKGIMESDSEDQS
jgi:hypothetical protein